MILRRIVAILSAVIMLLTLCSCNSLDLSIEGLISPPLQDGNIYPIQKALELSVGKEITLKYPISGEYRSAFSFKDIDGDGVDEALALYSMNNDGTVSMHLNVIDYVGDEWVSKSDVKVVGTGIEKITFCDLNNDDTPEIIVGWMIYGAVDKQVGVYSYDGASLNQRAVENYTDFLCDTLKPKGNDELIIINLNTKDKTSTIRLLAINDNGIAETGSAMLDGGVSSYMTPIVSTLSDGRPALYLDAIKGTGTLTEIIWFEGSALKSTFDAVSETSITFRPAAAYVTDINGDGVLEVPIMDLLVSTLNRPESERAYITFWSSFNGKNFKKIEDTLMNYIDGYYLIVPNKWKDKLYLARKTESRLRIFYSYDAKNDTQGNEVFRIVAATSKDIEEGKYDNNGYQRLGEYNDTVYVVKVEEENDLGITFKELSDNFRIIK